MTLVDAEANEEVGPLVRHSTISLADLGTDQLSAVLTWSGTTSLRSVAFYLDSDTITTTENAAPLCLLGDNGRNRNRQYTPWTATTGTHTIVAELFNGKKLRGDLLCTVTYTFTIVDRVITLAPTSTSPTPAPSLSPTTPTVSPTPTPTLGPSPSPSQGPTTTGATLVPTPSPIPNPTASPTQPPTPAPTPGPTDSPTAAPTLPACAELVDMTLVDAEANEEVGPLVRQSTINLADLGTDQLSTVLTWSGTTNTVKSVAFYLDSDTITTTENVEPFSLLSDRGKNRNLQYTPWTATTGTHTIVAELFNRKKLKGDLLCTVTYTFAVVDGVSPTPAPTPSPTPGPTPSPMNDPTPSPTPYPTPSPTPAPTPGPTPSPTPAPTPNPTEPQPPTNPPLICSIGHRDCPPSTFCAVGRTCLSCDLCTTTSSFNGKCRRC